MIVRAVFLHLIQQCHQRIEYLFGFLVRIDDVHIAGVEKIEIVKINDEGELVVRTLDNEELTVYSGEITRLVLNDK